MSNLRLYKDGFKLWKYEELDDLKQSKIDGKWCVVSEETGISLHEFDTEEECLNWSCHDEEIECIFANLREPLEIVGDVTLGDLVSACRLSGLWEIMSVLSPRLYHSWPNGRVVGFSGVVSDTIDIGLKGVVEEGLLTIDSEVKYPAVGNTYEDLADCLITVSDSFRIYHVEHPYPNAFSGSYSYSLLEILWALSGHPEPRVHTLTKDGIWEPLLGRCPGRSLVCTDKNVQVASFRALLYPIIVEEDVTLGDLFKIVEEDEDLSTFISAYSWCWKIDEFHAQAKLPPEINDHEEKIWHSYVSASLDTHENKDGISADFSVDFFGEGELSAEEREHWAKTEVSKWPTSTKYGLSMSPINTIAHLPFRTSDEFLVHGIHKVATGEKSKKGRAKCDHKFVEHLRCRRNLTLLDILDAVYWEISFHGGPAENKAMLEDLRSRVDSIKRETRWDRRLFRKLRNAFFWMITAGKAKPKKIFYSVDDMLDDIGVEIEDE